MKKSTIGLICGLLFIGFFSLQAVQNVTIYCDEGYPPYSFIQGNTAQGIYVDILQTAFSQMPDYKVTITPVPWKRGLDLVKSGDGLALFPPYFRPKERPWLDYSVNLLDEELVVFIKDKNASNFKEYPKDFIGKRIAINAGFSVINTEDKGKFIIDEGKDNKICILKLNMDRVDAYINDRNAILYEIVNLKKTGELKEDKGKIISGALVSKETAYLAFTNQDKGTFPFKKDFQDKLKVQLDKMRKSGEINKIVAKWTK